MLNVGMHLRTAGLLAILLSCGVNAAAAQECDCLTGECPHTDLWSGSGRSRWPFTGFRESRQRVRAPAARHAHPPHADGPPPPVAAVVGADGAYVWDHAGLLGQRYVGGNYIYFAHGDDFLDQLDDDFEGWGAVVNVPLLHPGHDYWLGIDLFASWNTLNLGGATQLPPPFPVGIQFDSDATNTAVGTTLYTDAWTYVRPFVQLGAALNRDRSLLLIDGFGGSFVNRDTSFLFTAGLECDLTDWLAFRGLFDIETEDSLGDTVFRGDLIAWPTDRLFVRGGAIVPLEGDGIGGVFGIGVTF